MTPTQSALKNLEKEIDRMLTRTLDALNESDCSCRQVRCFLTYIRDTKAQYEAITARAGEPIDDQLLTRMQVAIVFYEAILGQQTRRLQ